MRSSLPCPPIVSVYRCARWTLGQIQESYLNYKNAGNELVGGNLTGIPPILGEFGVSAFYYNSHANINLIKKLSNFIFPEQDVKAINLIHAMMAYFIFHEKWTKSMILNDSSLLDSRYYSFANLEPN